MSEVDATVVVVFHKIAFPVPKNHEGIPSRPEYTAVPATLSEYRPTSVNPTPSEALQVERPERVFLF
jgi:hypothetical protein